MDLTFELLLDIFSWGVDYGQLLAEEERDSEDLFDAFICYGKAQKTAMPSAPIERRKPMSDKWRNAKRQGYKNFLELIPKVIDNIKQDK